MSRARLIFALFLIIAVPLACAADAASALQQARQALTGVHKDELRAKALLLDVVAGAKNAEDVVWAEIYLGYIQDRAHNRQAAVAWYQKAMAVAGASSSGVQLAQFGIDRPLTWLRHLDATSVSTSQPGEQGAVVPAVVSATPASSTGRPARAYMTQRPPDSLPLAKDLTAEERRENFEALWSMIDANYGQFKLKSIDWAEIGRRYRARLETVTSDGDFYRLMWQLVQELKDTHSWLNNYSPPILGMGGAPAMPILLFQDGPHVVAGPKAGWEVVSVDGMTVAERMEYLRPLLPARSSERAFRRDAARNLLAGKRGEAATVVLRSPQGATETLTVERTGRAVPPPVPYLAVTPAFALTQQKFVHYGRLPSGIGYIQIALFEGRDEIVIEFDRALTALHDTPALVVDVRDNPGGRSQPEIIGRLLTSRKVVDIGYKKRGVRHDSFERRKTELGPSGIWQYTRPVALLINAGTGSAADLFTVELHSAGRVTTVGSTTHGNLSGYATYAVLPCGLVVRISNGYVSDAHDRPVEVNGNTPDIPVEPTVDDFLNGRDPVLEKAVEHLQQQIAKKQARFDARGDQFVPSEWATRGIHRMSPLHALLLASGPLQLATGLVYGASICLFAQIHVRTGAENGREGQH